MNIRKENNTIFLSPEAILNLTRIETDKSLKINENGTAEFVDDVRGEIIDIDARKMKKEKAIVRDFFFEDALNNLKSPGYIHSRLKDKFIMSEAFSMAVKDAFSTGSNMIVYGKGGFGKSEMISEIMRTPGLEGRTFTMSLNEATTVEHLMGGINMKTLTDKGSIEYLCENSWANKEIAIFEEMFDAPANVLMALKDALTSGYVRNGNQLFKIKTKIIFGLTNKSPREVSSEPSFEALTQRFPMQYIMQYPMEKYIQAALLKMVCGMSLDETKASTFLQLGMGENMSPRQIIAIGRYLKNKDLSEMTRDDFPVIVAGIDISKVIIAILESKKEMPMKESIKNMAISKREKTAGEIGKREIDRIIDIITQ